MLGKRLAVDTLVAIGAALVLAGAALQLAPVVGRAVLAHAGVEQVVLVSPTDLEFRSLAVPFFAPPLFAWLAGLIVRLRRRVVPSVTSLAIAAGAVTVATTAGIAVQAYEVSSLFARDLVGDIRPMISPDSLALAGAGWRWCVLAGLVVCAASLRRPHA